MTGSPSSLNETVVPLARLLLMGITLGAVGRGRKEGGGGGGRRGGGGERVMGKEERGKGSVGREVQRKGEGEEGREIRGREGDTKREIRGREGTRRVGKEGGG